MDEDGLFTSNPDHWEMWETKVYRYTKTRQTAIHVPINIVRHLKLEHKGKVIVAIRLPKPEP